MRQVYECNTGSFSRQVMSSWTLPYRRGSKIKSAKLNKVLVKEIRSLYKTGSYTQKQLAQKFSVSSGTINRVVNGYGW